IVVGLESGKYLRDPKGEQRTGRIYLKRAQDQMTDYHGAEYCFRDCPRVPYRLPKVLTAETVYLVEAEQDVHTLQSWGLLASCNANGAGSSSQFKRWLEYFRGRDIIILPDNDLPGCKHAAAVASALAGCGKTGFSNGRPASEQPFACDL